MPLPGSAVSHSGDNPLPEGRRSRPKSRWTAPGPDPENSIPAEKLLRCLGRVAGSGVHFYSLMKRIPARTEGFPPMNSNHPSSLTAPFKDR